MNKLKFSSRTLFLLFIFLLLLAVGESFARAGGAGGKRRSGSRKSKSTTTRSYSKTKRRKPPTNSNSSSQMSPGAAVVFFIIFIVIVVIVIMNNKNGVSHYGDSMEVGDDDQLLPIPQRKNVDRFIKNNSDFNESQFLEKVRKAFLEIQNAWSNKELKEVRRYISDGIWQRFHTQFTMMNELQQTNRLENVVINDCFLDVYEEDGNFDVLHVAVSASLQDYFECALDSSMNAGGSESFVEYWSFIRKKDAQDKDMYNSTSCPSCGAEIEDALGEVAQCPYCSTMINSGAFDWVLAEITQAEDYRTGVMGKAKNLSIKTEQLVAESEDFSVQQIEDHVSNGYLQFLAAKVLHKPERVSRFFSDELFKSVSPEIQECDYLYNRLYLNEVTLIAAEQKGEYNNLYVSVTESSMKVKKENGSLTKLDPVIVSTRNIVKMKRKVSASVSKGALYMHQCATCGATVTDTLDTSCPYCGSMFNSGDNEWVFDAIMSPYVYKSYADENKSQFSFAVKFQNLESIMSIKEYAINNIMTIIAADGKMTDEEFAFLNEFATRMKFSPKEKNGIIAAAKQNRLRLAFPEDQESCLKIYNLMVEAAEADGQIQPQEQEILTSVRNFIAQK